ncbi:MAG: hypothetical protein LCH46_05995 [Proteobacteria bacterium]|nr:hypothetical protein [Pseudomonadota bacterium]
MSETESLLLLGFGFAAALVVAMVFGYAIWAAANRWADRKRKLEVPSLILDLQAEREALRAQNAMTARRLEFELEQSRDQAAEFAAEVTRHRNRAILFAKTLQAKDSEILTLRSLATELTDETNRRAKIIARLTGREATNLRSVSFPEMNAIRGATVNKEAFINAPAAPKPRSRLAELQELADVAKKRKVEPLGPAVFGETPSDSIPRRDPVPAALAEGEDIAEAKPDSEVAPASLEPLVLIDTGEKPVELPQEQPAERAMTLAEKFRMLRNGMNQ